MYRVAQKSKLYTLVDTITFCLSTVLNCTSVLSLLILSTDLFDCLQFIFFYYLHCIITLNCLYCVRMSHLINDYLLTYLYFNKVGPFMSQKITKITSNMICILFL